MKIAISIGKSENVYKLYSEWLKKADSSIEIEEFIYTENVDEAKLRLEKCSGILFTGGMDIEPNKHNRPELNDTIKYNSLRDSFEFELLDKAFSLNLPILGICRGAQLINVKLSGDLYVDIPTEIGDQIEHRKVEGIDSQHSIEIEPGSLLYKITKTRSGIVNSLHHEAVRNLNRFCSASARSQDQVIEAYEWNSIKGRTFLLCAQWHPELMDFSNALSGAIAKHFLMECESFFELFQRSK